MSQTMLTLATGKSAQQPESFKFTAREHRRTSGLIEKGEDLLEASRPDLKRLGFSPISNLERWADGAAKYIVRELNFSDKIRIILDYQLHSPDPSTSRALKGIQLQSAVITSSARLSPKLLHSLAGVTTTTINSDSPNPLHALMLTFSPATNADVVTKVRFSSRHTSDERKNRYKKGLEQRLALGDSKLLERHSRQLIKRTSQDEKSYRRAVVVLGMSPEIRKSDPQQLRGSALYQTLEQLTAPDILAKHLLDLRFSNSTDRPNRRSRLQLAQKLLESRLADPEEKIAVLIRFSSRIISQAEKYPEKAAALAHTLVQSSILPKQATELLNKAIDNLSFLENQVETVLKELISSELLKNIPAPTPLKEPTSELRFNQQEGDSKVIFKARPPEFDTIQVPNLQTPHLDQTNHTSSQLPTYLARQEVTAEKLAKQLQEVLTALSVAAKEEQRRKHTMECVDEFLHMHRIALREHALKLAIGVIDVSHCPHLSERLKQRLFKDEWTDIRNFLEIVAEARREASKAA